MPNIKSWAMSAQNNRWKASTLTRLRIGHAKLTHGILMAGTYQVYCDNCIVHLTVQHITSARAFSARVRSES